MRRESQRLCERDDGGGGDDDYDDDDNGDDDNGDDVYEADAPQTSCMTRMAVHDADACRSIEQRIITHYTQSTQHQVSHDVRSDMI